MTEQSISPLRRRMIEDMTIRKFAQKTQHDYVQRVKDFASYLKRSPDTAKPEDVRGFQLHLASSGAGVPKINTTISALRFFFRVTLDRPDLSRHLSTIHKPRKAPVVLALMRWRVFWRRHRASNTRPRSVSPMARGCASPRLPR